MDNKVIKNREIQPVVYEFTHPGNEHNGLSKLKPGTFIKGWNLVEAPGEKGPSHRRKYIRSSGKYIDINGVEKNAELDFWGEWEPDSIARKTNRKGQHNLNPEVLPSWIHSPFFLNTSYPYNAGSSALGQNLSKFKNDLHELIERDKRKLQNTDPFVYGKMFMYSSICKPEQTLDLRPGSIILFGSCHKYKESSSSKNKIWRFRVDTVFVIKEVIDFSDDVFSSYQDTIYYKAALKFIDRNDGYSHKLFVGATPENSMNGMYSFTPAHLSSDIPYGPMVIDDTKEPFKKVHYVQSKGTEVAVGEQAVKVFWEALLRFTYDNGYVPATQIELPPVFDTIDKVADWINR